MSVDRRYLCYDTNWPEEDAVEVTAPTRSEARELAAEMLGIDEEDVTVTLVAAPV